MFDLPEIQDTYQHFRLKGIIPVKGNYSAEKSNRLWNSIQVSL